MKIRKSASWRDLIVLGTLGAEPAYKQIGRRLEALIQSGEIPTGTVLPSERAMSTHLSVSRITIQNAYNELRKRRLVLSKGRGGSVVLPVNPRIVTPMNRLRGFTEEMQELGKVPSAQIVEAGVTRDAGVAAIMGLPEEAPLLRLKRIRFADGMPMSKELAWYNLLQAPFLENIDLSKSIYTALSESGLALTSCDQVIHVVMATAEDLSIFGFTAEEPCMLIKRRSYTEKGMMMEYVEGRFRGDVYSYRMTLDV